MADHRYERTDRDICQAFLDLIRSAGFEALNVSKIATAALVDRSTFYAHYESVYALSKAMITEQVAIIGDALTTSLPVGPGERYQFFSQTLVTHLVKNSAVIAQLRLISLGTASFDAQCRQLFTTYYQRTVGLADDSFTSYLFVNMAMSDLDFMLTHQRAPQRQELRASLQQIEQIVRQLAEK